MKKELKPKAKQGKGVPVGKEKHYPFIGGSFDRIVFDGDNTVWIKDGKHAGELKEKAEMYRRQLGGITASLARTKQKLSVVEKENVTLVNDIKRIAGREQELAEYVAALEHAIIESGSKANPPEKVRAFVSAMRDTLAPSCAYLLRPLGDEMEDRPPAIKATAL